MANNIIGGQVNIFYYGDVGRGRLSGTLQPGEVNLVSLLTSARVNSIYAANSAGGFKSFVPGSSFPSLQTLEPGEGYFVDAKTSFEMPGILPQPVAAKQATAIDYLRQGAPDKWIDKSNTLANGLKAYYVGNENKDIANGVSGILKAEGGGSGNFSYITLEAGRAIAASSINDYITLSIPAIAGTYGDFTLMFSGRIVDGSNNSLMISLLKNSTTSALSFGGFLPATEGDLGNVSVDIKDAQTGTQAFFAGGQYAKNTYSTYVVRRTGNVLKIFRNGLAVTTDQSWTIGDLQLNGTIVIGRAIDGSAASKAQIQAALISLHGRSLSDSEILALHTEPFNPFFDIAKIAEKYPASSPSPSPSGGAASSVRAYAVHNSVFDSCGVYSGSFLPMAATRGKIYTRGRHMIPGAPLSWIWQHPDGGFMNPAYPEALAQSWDRLILQPFDRGLGGTEGDVQMSKNFMNLAIASNTNIDTYIYSHWMRKGNAPGLNYQSSWNQTFTGGQVESKTFFEQLVTQLRTDYGGSRAAKIMMIPAGDIMNELDIRMKAGQIPGYTNIFDIYADDIHLNDVGQFISGCGLFATIFKESPVGLATTTYNFNNPTLGNLLADAVWDVVNGHPFSGVNV